MPNTHPELDTAKLLEDAEARIAKLLDDAERKFTERISARLMAQADNLEIIGPVPYGGIVKARGIPPADQAQLRADLEAASGHSQFVVVNVNAKGDVTLDGDAKIQEAMVATLTDKVQDKLVDRAEKHVVERVQPVLALLQKGDSAAE